MHRGPLTLAAYMKAALLNQASLHGLRVHGAPVLIPKPRLLSLGPLIALLKRARAPLRLPHHLSLRSQTGCVAAQLLRPSMCRQR